MDIAAIILAAGSSSRMGRSKQMLDIYGEKLLVKTIDTFLDARISKVVVVLGANESAHRRLIEGLPVEAICNHDWASGMGSSIKAGLRHVCSEAPSVEAVIISVCDQPLLTDENITRLITRHHETGKPIIASGYSDVPGVPVLFCKTYFEKLAKLQDDQGAKKLILQNTSDVSVVPFPGGEVDLDTMEDYQGFMESRRPGASDPSI